MRLKMDGFTLWLAIMFVLAFFGSHWAIILDRQHWGIFINKWLNDLRWPFDNTGVMLIGEEYYWVLYVAYVVLGIMAFIATDYVVKKAWKESAI